MEVTNVALVMAAHPSPPSGRTLNQAGVIVSKDLTDPGRRAQDSPPHEKGRCVAIRRVRRGDKDALSALEAELLVMARAVTALAVVSLNNVSTDPYTDSTDYHQPQF